MLVVDHIFHEKGLKIPSLDLAMRGQTQQNTAITHTRLSVASCLYLSPSNIAESMSTPIAGIVHMDIDKEILPPTRRA